MVLKYRIVFCICVLISSFSVYASGLDSLRTEFQDGQYFVIHKVEKGETLYSLSRRYGCELAKIKAANGLADNNISLGQELRIPIAAPKKVTNATPSKAVEATSKLHTVKAGETLFAISRLYGVEVAQLKEWNGLQSNEISIGQVLAIADGVKVESPKSEPIVSVTEEKPKETEKPKEKEKKQTKKAPVESVEIPDGFNTYYVQTGDLLETIAAKFKVRPDSIVIWNKLPNTYLSIGQKLLIKGEPDEAELSKKKNEEMFDYGTRKKVTDQSGFTKVIEEGAARKIEDVVETKKYLALHRTLPIGSMLEVRNLMNNQKIFVRVVGKLPETGLNKNVLVRLSPICFERLGVIDPMTRVEISYYED